MMWVWVQFIPRANSNYLNLKKPFFLDKMRIGYIVGVWDLFHYGHKNMINQSKEMCDKLVIGIHTDSFTESYKRKPINDEITRLNDIKQYVEATFPNVGSFDFELIDDNHIKLIEKYKINIIIHGNDWNIESYKKQINYYTHGMDKLGVEIILINYSKGISTTSKINGLQKLTKNCYLFDLDNTLLLNKKATLYAKDLIEKINKANHDIYVVTNNNRYSPLQICKDLQSNDLNIKSDNIISTLSIINTYLVRQNIKNIYVWGTDDAKSYFVDNNFNVSSSDSPPSTSNMPELVIVLYNNEFNYDDLVQMINIIKDTNYIVGNIDRTYPDKDYILPDTGSIWKLIEYTLKKSPIEIFGKPNIIMLEDIMKKYTKKEIIFIGDSLLTDKQLAINSEIDFLHVAPDGDISHLGVMCDYL